MAEGKALSTTDLLLLMVGWNKLKKPPDKPASAEDYWTTGGDLRESEWNSNWFSSPKDAWESVRYREWLMANIAANLTDRKQDFIAISEPVFVSLDLLPNEIKPGMPIASKAITEAVEPAKSDYMRSFLNTLSLGISKRTSGGKDLFVIGGGMRRRTRVWRKGTTEDFALQADVEFFVPFYIVPGQGQSSDNSFPDARSICAGIAITRANGSSIGVDKDGKDLAAVRFNFRIPFTAKIRSYDPMKQIGATVQMPWQPDELETKFGLPVVEVQKRAFGSKQSAWEKFDNWKAFVKFFCEGPEKPEDQIPANQRPDNKALLNAPIGPLLLETVSNNSGIKDIIRKRDELEEEKEETTKELDEAVKLLKSIWEGGVPKENPDPENISASSSQRRLGHMLEALGFLKSAPASGGDYDYSLKELKDLKVWDVLNGLINELDGFPLYIKGQDPKDDKKIRGALALASQTALTNSKKHYFGLAGLAYNIPLKTAGKAVEVKGDEEPKKEGEKKEPESELEIKLHLGKWFDGETLDDNWFRRLLPTVEISKGKEWKWRVPLPGIRLLPFQRTEKDNNQVDYALALRADLLSFGLDFTGSTEDGLAFFKNKNLKSKNPISYFHLDRVETRFALLFSGDRVAFGAGVKLKDMRVSFAPVEEEKEEEKKPGYEILDDLKGLLGDDDWVGIDEPEKPKELQVHTRLTAKKKDKFSISVGYLTPLFDGYGGTLDVQLYDEKGVRGKMVWIPIDRSKGPVYVKHIGLGLKGFENLELGKKLSSKAQLIFAITGGLRMSVFELGFIGAKLALPLTNPQALQFSLDGLDISFKVGDVVISGSFLKSGLEFAGSLTIEAPKFSIGAMGFYGSLVVFSKTFKEEVLTDLKRIKIHDDLMKELVDNKVEPKNNRSVFPYIYIPDQPDFPAIGWNLYAKDEKTYTILYEDGKLHVLRPEKTFFIYGIFSAASGCGINIGPIRITGLAVGFGYNRKMKIPRIEQVAEFPLVQMVMGKGGYQKKVITTELREQLGAAVEDPISVLEDMKDHLVPEPDQYFFALGVRFTIATVVDCFALAIVQVGKELDITLMGLARFRQPSDMSAKPLCYVEMQVLMSINPKDGVFKLQALLTSNSWIINRDCKLTGGFALFVWFDGKHKGDGVLTIGGYHPRFQKPDHYPTVPRLGFSWQIGNNLAIKGGAYFAITPSCCMVGARLEATFHSGRVTAWFTAYLDAIISWKPGFFELDIGISLRVEAALFLFTLKVTISVTLRMWGPPVGGIARIDLTVISFEIPIGTPRDQANPELIKSWAEFSRSFLSASEADKKAIEKPPEKKTDKPVNVSPIVEPNLAEGRNNLNNMAKARNGNGGPPSNLLADTTPPASNRDDSRWIVRGDELVLAASASVPVTKLNVGRVKTNSPPEGVQERDMTGKTFLVASPVALESGKVRTKNSGSGLGVQPMGKTLESVLNVTVVRDEGSKTLPIDLSEWTFEEETGSLPAALWDATKPSGPPEPSAKLIPDCITGIKRLKPQAGKRGQKAVFSNLSWHRLDPVPVPLSTASQEVPSKTRSRSVQDAMADKKEKQKSVAEALASIGFELAWNPEQADMRFRELQAEPMTYDVT